MQLKELRGNFFVDIPVAGQATAGTADEFTGFVAPFNVKVTGAVWIPKASVTANGTNFFTLGLRNRGAAGAGSTYPATRSYAATNSTALVPENMTLSATATDLNLATGDHLTADKVNTGTGLAMPAGTVRVYVQVR
jgi:hypothetical protein